MKKLIFVFFLFIYITSISQSDNNTKYCGQHHILREALKNPDRLKVHLAEQAILKQKENLSNTQKKKIIYTVPVVFHVIHRNGVENVSRAQIIDGLRVLNRDFRKLNIDATTVDPLFLGIVADIEINFVLATQAPDGSCFNGVTRTYSQTYSYVSSSNLNTQQIFLLMSSYHK